MIKGYCRLIKLTSLLLNGIHFAVDHVFCLVQGKSGCISLKVGGHNPPPLPFRLCYGMEYPFWTTVIKASMLGMVYLDLTARPLLLGY